MTLKIYFRFFSSTKIDTIKNIFQIKIQLDHKTKNENKKNPKNIIFTLF